MFVTVSPDSGSDCESIAMLKRYGDRSNMLGYVVKTDDYVPKRNVVKKTDDCVDLSDGI